MALTSHEARELDLYLENDADIYRQRLVPIYKNLQRKMDKGIYKRELAAKLYMYAVDDAAKKYHKEYGSGGKWHFTFPTSVRREVALEYAKSFEAEYKAGARF